MINFIISSGLLSRGVSIVNLPLWKSVVNYILVIMRRDDNNELRSVEHPSSLQYVEQ